jgi:hypothetical protein
MYFFVGSEFSDRVPQNVKLPRTQGRFQGVIDFLLARTSHRGIEPRCDFLTGYSLYRHHKSAVDIASGLPQALSLVQPKGLAAAMAVTAVAAKDVFCGLQVTELESFPRFFLFHFIFLSRCFGLP